MSTELPENLVEQELREPYLINLLFRSFRKLQTVMIPLVEAQGHQGIGLSEARLLLAIGVKGAQINVIADRTGTSRQYVSRVVHDLEARGYLRTEPDPEDRRATVATVEEQGLRYFQDLRKVKKSMDEVLVKALGREKMDGLIAVLQELESYSPET